MYLLHIVWTSISMIWLENLCTYTYVEETKASLFDRKSIEKQIHDQVCASASVSTT